jgi:hypothetical protein
MKSLWIRQLASPEARLSVHRFEQFRSDAL